jgi:hypothetical protein
LSIMKKLLLFLWVFIFSVGALLAQDDELPPPSSHPKPETFTLPGQPSYPVLGKNKKTDLSNYIIEPDLIVSFIQGGYTVGASPYVGYRLWKNLYGGGGLTYMYTGFKNIGYQDAAGTVHYTNASWNTLGGGVFLQYNIWKGIFVRDRFEVMHRWMDDVYNPSVTLNPQSNIYSVTLPKIQKTIPDMLLGAGYNILQGKSFFMPIMFSYNVLYPVTDKLYSPYSRGWVIQLGFIDVF